MKTFFKFTFLLVRLFVLETISIKWKKQFIKSNIDLRKGLFLQRNLVKQSFIFLRLKMRLFNKSNKLTGEFIILINLH